MPADRVADDVGKQLFPEEWREDLERQLKEGIGFACPHCKESISFQPDSDLEEDVKTRRTVIDRLLARGMWVVQIEDDECTQGADRTKPFYRVLTLGSDGKIQASTLMPDAMPEFLEDSARTAASAERSAARISETAADVRAVLHHTLTSDFGVPKENLDSLSGVGLVATLNKRRGDAEDAARTTGMAEGAKTTIGRILSERWRVPEKSLEEVPNAQFMGIFDDLFNDLLKNTKACIDENDETGKRLVALLGNRATDEDRDPDRTSLQALVDKAGAIHSEFVGAIATAIGVDLTQDAAADTKAIFERLQDLASNDPDTIIGIGKALGVDEGDMRRKMLATSATATGGEKAARAELAKSVTDTAKVMLARFKYACDAAGLDRDMRDNPNKAMQALSAIIGENRRGVTAVQRALKPR